jgi:hypothetical protein
MARFDLSSYETVEERHARALADNPDLRVVIVNHTTPQDRAASTWVVEARVYVNSADQEMDLPKATEWAFEVDGSGMANQTSALENACTSALGRALRWAFAGSKGPSAAEMSKVARGVAPRPSVSRDWIAESEALTDVDELRLLWREAKTAGASDDILEKVKTRAERLEGATSVGEGTDSGVPSGGRKKPTK